MAFDWTDTVVTNPITHKKVIRKFHVDGDIEGNFQVTAQLVLEHWDGATIVAAEVLDELKTDHDTFFADPLLEPIITALRNRMRQICRELKK